MPNKRRLADLDASPHAVVFEQPRTIKLALPAGEDVPEHRHPGETIVFHLLEGRLELTLGEDVLDVEAGDVLRFDGDRDISPNAITDSTALLVFVSDE